MSSQNITRRFKNSLWGVFLCSAPLVSFADGQGSPKTPSGLMWNRTGLPAVFPLQVKTPVGQDYFMMLVHPKSGNPALAAFIKGGAFFKVLVPPGMYDLRFARGERWINEKELFGPGDQTHTFETEESLSFQVRDSSTKAGHLIAITFPDQSMAAKTTVTDQFICQRLRIATFPRSQQSFEDVDPYRFRIPDEDKLVRFPFRYSSERLLDNGQKPIVPTRYAPYVSRPRYEVRATLC